MSDASHKPRDVMSVNPARVRREPDGASDSLGHSGSKRLIPPTLRTLRA